MSRRHNTPAEVASLLATYVPDDFRSLIEPSAGDGALLLPLLDRLRKADRVTCVDCDTDAILTLKRSFESELGASAEFVCDDFLTWCQTQPPASYDCALLNPPFAGRSSDLVRLTAPEVIGAGHTVRVAPQETAFVLEAARLLRPGGRLLAILPASSVAGARWSWGRKRLMEIGNLIYVHELPPWTFDRVEARVYLLAFEKGSKQGNLQIRNHRLLDHDTILLTPEQYQRAGRLDYGYVEADQWLGGLQETHPNLGWKEVGSVSQITRGRESSPQSKSGVLHTVHFDKKRWTTPSQYPNPTDLAAAPADILVKRVGRDAALTFGRYFGEPMPFSDCILSLRPRNGVGSTQLLFAIRTLVGWRVGARLLEKSTGATYISAHTLSALTVPVHLNRQFPKLYRKYKRAIQMSDASASLEIEENVRQILGRETFV